MNETENRTRRQFLRTGLLTSLVISMPQVAWSQCRPKPGAQPGEPNLSTWSGPFWREGTPFRQNLRGTRTDGRLLVVTGRVIRAEDCVPIPESVLDVWHCGPDGVYFTNTEQEAAGLFRGRVQCNPDGFYMYETLVPTPYVVDGAYRPAHIHVKVQTPGREDFVTQMYFEGDPYLDCDPLDLVFDSLVCRLTPFEPTGRYGGHDPALSCATTEFNLALPAGSQG